MALPKDAGLTLVEVLIVLAIIGVMGSVAVLGLGAVRGPTAEMEARRLAERLRLAVDETLVTSRPLALAHDGESYAFVTLDPQGGGWAPDATGLLGARRELPSGMRLQVNRPDQPVALGPNATGEPMIVTIDGDGGDWRVVFDGLNAVAEPAAGSN